MTNTPALRSITLSFILLVSSSFTEAQDRGTFHGYTAPSFEIGPAAAAVDSINPFNGNLNVSVPLINVGGRGNAGYSSGRTASIKWGMYHQWLDGHAQHFIHHPTMYSLDGSIVGSGEISYSPGLVEIKRTFIGNPNCYGDYSSYGEHWRIVFSRPDGNVMEFVSQQGSAEAHSWCPNGPSIPDTNFGTVFQSYDGSFATVVLDTPAFRYSTHLVNGYLMFPDGRKYRVENNRIVWMRDKDGNTATFTWAPVYYQGLNQGYKLVAAKDSIGREVTIEYKLEDNGQYGLHDRITYKGVSGDTRIFRVSFRLMGEILRADQTLQTKGALFAYWDHWGGANQTLNISRISAIWLPDGKAYKFFYNSYAEVARLEFPHGGAYEYDWGASLLGGDPRGLIQIEPYEPISNYSSLPDVNRRVLEKRIYPNGEAGTAFTTRITYSQTEGQGTSTTHNTVKTYDASGNLLSQLKHYFYGTPILQVERHPFSLPSPLEGLEFKTEVFEVVNNSPILNQRIERTWQPFGLGNPRNVETVTTLTDTNQVTKTTSISPIDGGIGFDQFNNPTDVWEYDFGNGQPGPLLSRTHADYVADGNYTSPYGSHLRNLPLQTWISSDAAGNNKGSLTQFEYDNYTADANHAPLVSRSNVSGHDSANYGPGFSRRGNVTAAISYANAQAQTGEVTAYSQYDILGNIVKSIDPNGNISIISYDDNFGMPDGEATTNTPPVQLNGLSTFAFPTSTTNPMGWTNRVQYDYFIGAPVNAQDTNGLISKKLYNDLLDRLTQTVSAIGTQNEAQSSVTYNDELKKVTKTSDLFALNDNQEKTETFYDGFGRTVETRSYKDGDYISVRTEYDPMGRVSRVTNPFRPLRNEALLWTKTKYDALGRIVEIETPDTSKVKQAYTGTRTLVTDQAGKQRISRTNARGQLTDVWEVTGADQWTEAVSFPNQSLSAGYRTSYSYDALDNLTTVSQGEQTRTFTYDALSRLLSATNPEAGTIRYVYDPNGNLKAKRDARNIKTVYDYDGLNRVTKRCYRFIGPGNLGMITCAGNTEPPEPNTPDVTYSYGTSAPAIGKLVKVESGVSTTEYTSFDISGRATASRQTTDGVTYGTGSSDSLMTYSYNLAGALVEQQYPSGRVVKNILESDGHLSIVQSRKNGNSGYWNYASHFTYNATGVVTSMQLGNGRWGSMQFNSRLQPTQIALGATAGSTDLLDLDYEYGVLSWNGTVDPEKNNGNVAKQKISVADVGATRGFHATQYYMYDSLNRLQIATENILPNGGTPEFAWRQHFKFDRYGNRNFVTSGDMPTTTLGNCPTAICNPTISTANNRINASGYSFDVAGNTTRDASDRKFTYDAENKQIRVESLRPGTNTVTGTIGEYQYDGDGRRVKKYVPSTGETTIFVYDAADKLIAEYSTIVASPQDAKIAYLTNDHLGSPRINTDGRGTVTARHDYHPFGEVTTTPQRHTELGYVDDTVRKQFTGYERDSETELDFAQARFLASNQGRFTTVDPIRQTSPINPQTLNKYVYAINSPYRFVDRRGEWPTENHNLIFLLSLPGLSREEMARMQDGSYSVDMPKTVFGYYANQHGMCKPSQTPSECAVGVITAPSADFVRAGKARDRLTAHWYLGKASHTGHDMRSPPHRFQVYDDRNFLVCVLSGGTNLAACAMSAKEALDHSKQEKVITPTQLNDLIQWQRQYYEARFGKTAMQRAVGIFANAQFQFDGPINGKSLPTVVIDNLGVVTIYPDGREEYAGPLKKEKK